LYPYYLLLHPLDVDKIFEKNPLELKLQSYTLINRKVSSLTKKHMHVTNFGGRSLVDVWRKKEKALATGVYSIRCSWSQLKQKGVITRLCEPTFPHLFFSIFLQIELGLGQLWISILLRTMCLDVTLVCTPNCCQEDEEFYWICN